MKNLKEDININVHTIKDKAKDFTQIYNINNNNVSQINNSK